MPLRITSLSPPLQIWSLGPIERLIDESDGAVDGCVGGGVGATPAAAAGPRRAFPTRVVQQPLFSTLRVRRRSSPRTVPLFLRPLCTLPAVR